MQSRANHSSSSYPAANMLQSMVALHEKVCKGQIMTPKPLPIINKEVQRQQQQQQQARKRKPDKSSICHLIPQVILQEEPEPEITITPTVHSRLSSPPDEKQPTTSKRSRCSTESLESMSGVMRVRPNLQRKFDNNGLVEDLQASQVSFF